MSQPNDSNHHRSRFLAVILAGALAITACSSTEDPTEQAEGEPSTLANATQSEDTAGVSAEAGEDEPTERPVAVCELAYYTGEFASFGPFLTADVTFPVEQVINTDPPLGRTWELFSEDLGTLGEAQATSYCLDEHDADIIVSIAHGYGTYRDQMLAHWATEDGPLAPSVHGGAIPGNLGGTALEPIFRAQGLDEGLGTSGALHAEAIGAERVMIVATDTEGFQLAADAATEAAAAVGIEVVARVDVAAEQSSYADVVVQLRTERPDAVIVQAGILDSATLVGQAHDAGLSLTWIGETGWGQPSFLEALGSAPLTSQREIGYAAFSPRTSSPAWDFFSERWEATPGYGDTHGEASDSYHFSTYDLLIHTALAVEAGGSYRASDWAPAMHEVGEAPGIVCHLYDECLALIRSGEDIDYEGVTGSGDYTDGGVNNVGQTYTAINRDGSKAAPVVIDPIRSLEIIDEIANAAVCDAPSPPNTCRW